MLFDLQTHPYPSYRTSLMAMNGVVAASHPLAAQAGLQILHAGGSAIDAALATAACLVVMEPTANGLGGDAFALVWDGEKLHGLNGSGRAPAALTPDILRRAGHQTMPTLGWLTVTVPGVVAAWHDLHQRFGKLSFEQVLQPAITYAEAGHPLAPQVARLWAAGIAKMRGRRHPMYAGFLPTFAPGSFVAKPGAIYRNPSQARTLQRIAQQGAQDFYQGEIAAEIAAFAAQTGGALSLADLADHTSTWVEPISIRYRGYDVWELPPNGQGLAALMTLGMLDGLDIASHPRDSALAYHLQIEAMKLGFADAHRYIADPDQVAVPTTGLLDPYYLATRRALIGAAARTPEPGNPPVGGTVYLSAADRDGQMVSLIQSTFMGFGSGVVIPGWGIALHNRAAGFSLAPDHPNVLAPGKRPFHTIIPAFLTHQGEPIGPFGVMGGGMQPQGHTQVMVNTLDYALHPQAALDAPRWRYDPSKGVVLLELETPRAIAMGLLQRGHTVQVEADPKTFGRGQAIWRLPSGVYVAGTEARTDGCALGW